MYRREPFRRLSLLLLASTALSSPALALDPSGAAVSVDRLTNAAGPGGVRVLESQGPVYMGDEITTDPNGLAQIRFVDDTKIVVGRNSRLVIDSFVFNPDNTAQRVTVDAVKGFFRFISGNSPSGAYTVRTPTMTIGIRGTTLDIHSHGAGSRAVFHEGSGFGQDASGQSMDFAAGDCTINVAPTGGGFETPGGLDRSLQLSAYFPFIADQSNLDAAFRADISSCGVVSPSSQPSREGGASPPTPSFDPPAPESRSSSSADVSG